MLNELKKGHSETVELLNNYVFLLLFLAMQVGNQPLYFGPMRLSAVFAGPAVLIAALTFFNLFPISRIKIAIFFSLLISIFIAMVFGRDSLKGILEIFSFPFLLYSGAHMINRHENKFFFQLHLILFVSLVFALAQCSGAFFWSNYFTVLAHSIPDLWRIGSKEIQFNILNIVDMANYFRDLTPILKGHSVNVFTAPHYFTAFPMIQYRPAGIVVTTAVLSLFILVGFAITLRRKTLKAYVALLPLCFLMILSMAKIVFLGFVLLCLLSFLIDRFRFFFQMMICFVSSVLFLVAYRIYLGVYLEVTLSRATISTSFFSRFVNFINQLPKQSLLYKIATQFIEPTTLSSYTSKDITSSYQLILQHPQLVLIAAALFAVVLILYFRSFSDLLKLRKLDRNQVRLSTSILLVLVLFLGSTPFHKAKIYWFFMGGVMAPFLGLLYAYSDDKKRI